jgi:NitT/TauT family transport system substrate-binding protein
MQRPSRRSLLTGALLAGAILPLARTARPLAAPALNVGARRKVTVSWNQSALCVSFVPMAIKGGYFEKHGLDVDLVNFGGSTDQLLEAVATGKSDVAEGMILRWLKPLEAGFDVKLVAGLHGGCSYLVGSRKAGITDIASLRGKAIGVADLTAPDKNLFSILLRHNGVDPDREVTWKQYPPDLAPVAVQKGEIQAYSGGDPLVYLQVERSGGDLFRIVSNATGEFGALTCCVLGLRGSLVREDPETAKAASLALIEACQAVYRDPDLSIKYFAEYTPQTVSIAALSEMLKSYRFEDQPVGDAFRAQIATYARDLKEAGVLRANTDPERFARRVVADVV